MSQTPPETELASEISRSEAPVKDVVIDLVEERKLRRKIDLFVLPIVTLAYWLCVLDRANIGNAAASGLVQDLRLHRYDFNAGTSLYYVAYVAFDIVSGLMVKRYGFMLVPLSVILFGCVTLSQAWLSNRTGFYLTRVALGIAESIPLPGISYLLTRYYRRGELTVRYGCFMIASAGLAGAFGGLIAAGLLSVGKIGSREGWRVIFLVEGILTIGIGTILLFVFPDDPERTRYLNEQERELAIKRIYVDQPQVLEAFHVYYSKCTELIEMSTFAKIKETKEKIQRDLVRRGLFNINTLGCIWIFSCGNLTVQGLGIFLPSVLRVNYPNATTVRIQLLTAPVYIASMCVGIFVTYMCVRLRIHWYFTIGGSCLAILGYGLWVGTGPNDSQVRYAACFINMTAGFTMGPVAIGWSAANASPDTIRAMVGAVVTGVGVVGAIAGLWAYPAHTAASGYRPGNIFNVAMAASSVVCAVGLYMYQKMENKRRTAGLRDYRLEKGGIEKLGNLHPSYLYIH